MFGQGAADGAVRIDRVAIRPALEFAFYNVPAEAGWVGSSIFGAAGLEQLLLPDRSTQQRGKPLVRVAAADRLAARQFATWQEACREPPDVKQRDGEQCQHGC